MAMAHLEIKAEDLVTKEYLKKEMQILETNLQKDLAVGLEQTKNSLIKWMLGLVFIPIVVELFAKHFGL